MSADDQIRPYRAKGQEAADAVEAVLQHAAARDEAQHKKQPSKKQAKWMLPLGINLGVFAVYLLIAPPAWVIVNPLESAPVEEQIDDLRLAMFFQASRVDAYALQNGQLPDALEDAGSVVPGVDYTVQGPGRYQLIASVGDEVLLYDSSESAQEWVGAEAGRKLREATR